MVEGKVKFFDDEKGYGFVLTDEHEGDIFFHYTAIDMEGYKKVNDNAKVKIGEVLEDDDGLYTEKVVPK